MAAAGRGSAGAAKSSDRVSTELVALTYGAFVSSVVRDAENLSAANKELGKVGKNIGTRLADDFLSRGDPEAPVCRTFSDTMRTIGDAGFALYLGVKARVTVLSGSGGGSGAASGSGSGAAAAGGDKSLARATLTLASNPLADFVELPEGMESLEYNKVLCGALEGALEQIGYLVECSLPKDMVRGDATTEILVVLKEELKDAAGEEYKDE